MGFILREQLVVEGSPACVACLGVRCAFGERTSRESAGKRSCPSCGNPAPPLPWNPTLLLPLGRDGGAVTPKLPPASQASDTNQRPGRRLRRLSLPAAAEVWEWARLRPCDSLEIGILIREKQAAFKQLRSRLLFVQSRLFPEQRARGVGSSFQPRPGLLLKALLSFPAGTVGGMRVGLNQTPSEHPWVSHPILALPRGVT